MIPTDCLICGKRAEFTFSVLEGDLAKEADVELYCQKHLLERVEELKN